MADLKRDYAHTFAFIGAGNMASAFIFGMLNKGVCDAGDIIIYRRDLSKNAAFIKRGVHISTDETYVSDFSDAHYIFLAVKPSQLDAALGKLKASGADYSRSVFVSICAAVPCDHICRLLGVDAPVIRVMPSTPITVGKGTAAVSHNALVKKKDFELFCRMVSRTAQVTVIPEESQNAIISVNGSSPAYFYLFVKAMLDGASAQGIDPDCALPLILETMEGAAEMIRRSDKSIDELIREVSSPGGTTLAALKVFNDRGICDIVSDAMRACTNRADEMTSDLCAK